MRDEYALIVTFGLSLLLINLVDKVNYPYGFRGRPWSPFRASTSDRWSSADTGCSPCWLRRHHRRDDACGAIFLFGTTDPGGFAKPARGIAAGIDPGEISAIVFALSGGLAAISGALLANIFNPTPDVGAFPAVSRTLSLY